MKRSDFGCYCARLTLCSVHFPVDKHTGKPVNSMLQRVSLTTGLLSKGSRVRVPPGSPIKLSPINNLTSTLNIPSGPNNMKTYQNRIKTRLHTLLRIRTHGKA